MTAAGDPFGKRTPRPSYSVGNPGPFPLKPSRIVVYQLHVFVENLFALPPVAPPGIQAHPSIAARMDGDLHAVAVQRPEDQPRPGEWYSDVTTITERQPFFRM